MSFQVKVVTGKDGQAVTPVAIATQLPANVSAAFSVQQLQVIEATLILSTYYSAVIYSFQYFIEILSERRSLTDSLRCLFRDTKWLLQLQTLETWMPLRGNRLWCKQVGQGS